jgi:hypothetical protein
MGTPAASSTAVYINRHACPDLSTSIFPSQDAAHGPPLPCLLNSSHEASTTLHKSESASLNYNMCFKYVYYRRCVRCPGPQLSVVLHEESNLFCKSAQAKFDAGQTVILQQCPTYRVSVQTVGYICELCENRSRLPVVTQEATQPARKRTRRRK